MSSGTRQQVVFSNLAETAAKADLYIVSLTFSVLALSVQFAVPQDARALAELLQAIGWIFLTASGLAGVKLLVNLGDRYYFETARAEAEEAPLPDKGRALAAATRDVQKLAYDRWEERTEAQSGWLLPVQLWGLFLGITCLVLARISLLGILGG